MIFDAIRRWMGLPPGGNGRDGGPGKGDGMIACEDALARLYEYLDGELDGVSHEEVEAHLEICERCYPHLRLERSFREALHRAVDRQQAAPPELRSRVLDMIREESS